MWHQTLSHDQDTLHAEKWCAEMCNLCMAELMFRRGHGIAHGSSKPGNHSVCGLMQALMMHLIWEMGDFHLGMGFCYNTYIENSYFTSCGYCYHLLQIKCMLGLLLTDTTAANQDTNSTGCISYVPQSQLRSDNLLSLSAQSVFYFQR